MAVINTIHCFIRPEQNNILLSSLFQISRARYYANGEHNNPFILFSLRIITIFFSSLSGHCNSSIELFSMTVIPINPISNIQELLCLTSKEHIHDMYIIYIPELDYSSLYLFCQVLLQFLFQCSLSLRKNYSTSEVVTYALSTLS